MIPILNTGQIKALDAHTIAHEPVASIELMERACHAFFKWFTETFDLGHRIGIVCGPGNNGGDGLGIARLLLQAGYHVCVWAVRGGAPVSPDFQVNLERLAGAKVMEITAFGNDVFAGCDVLIDALFGSGLSRPLDGLHAEAVRAVNQADAVRVAVDVPSGLMADSPSGGDIVRAHYTVSFQLPKLAFFLPESYPYCGEWTTVDIGLDRDFIRSCTTRFSQTTSKACRKILKPRGRFSHKGTFGHALLVAGSHGKMGAAVLAARAATRSGVGLLTVHVPEVGYPIIQSAVPEAMASVDSAEQVFSSPPPTDVYQAVGVGPGLGTADETVEAFRRLVFASGSPMVIDADGLNILSMRPEILARVPQNSILTPHPGEFRRLAGPWANDFERLQAQSDFASEKGVIVVLKGAFSSIALPDGSVIFNPTGNAGMATGGSGDVLTGLLTGLLAQGYSPRDTAILGVYLHGLAGDAALPELGPEAMRASDLVDFLPQAFMKLTGFR